jgi:AraC family transcriptional regulator
MTLTHKALWYIESHFAEEITLEDIAAVAGVTRWHMSRAFGEATGHSVIGYVRGRRLSEAAKSLANGAPGILEVALDAGYGSHEAFTRAFREQFGLTPEELRAKRQTKKLQLVEPIKMNDMSFVKLDPPRIEQGKSMLIAGLSQHYTFAEMAGIPAQWQRFAPHLGHIPGQIGQDAYGVVSNADAEGFDYLCGVEVRDLTGLPKDFTSLRLQARTYAVFQHKAHISAIRATFHTIWNKALPESGHKAAEAPCFERYTPAFDPRTGEGGLEIWVPVAG